MITTTTLENPIIELEHLKMKILDCKNDRQLIAQIDDAISLVFQLISEPESRNFISGIQPSFGHLKELRAHLHHATPGQLTAYAHEINLALGVFQFSLWNKSNDELYKLLDTVRLKTA